MAYRPTERIQWSARRHPPKDGSPLCVDWECTGLTIHHTHRDAYQRRVHADDVVLADLLEAGIWLARRFSRERLSLGWLAPLSTGGWARLDGADGAEFGRHGEHGFEHELTGLKSEARKK